MYKNTRMKKQIIMMLISAVMILLLTRCALGVSQRLPRVQNTGDIVSFLNSFGWAADPEPVTVKNVQIPAKFTPVYKQYNELQKRQGFDLSKYRADIVESYSFRILNHPAPGDVFANVLVYKGRIIGGDICSFAINGFMTSLDGKSLTADIK